MTRGISVSALLEKAGVSRNAFYSLARKENILPNSIRAVASHLGVKTSEILEEEDAKLAGARVMARKIDKVMARHPDIDRDNVRHMLLLLQEPPIERLRRALIRAQKPDIH